MNDIGRKYKIVYLTPALYMAGGVERVLTLKASYFADQFGYDITIILTEGKEKPLLILGKRNVYSETGSGGKPCFAARTAAKSGSSGKTT